MVVAVRVRVLVADDVYAHAHGNEDVHEDEDEYVDEYALHSYYFP